MLGGNDEIYFGRKVILRVLSPLDPRVLAGLAADDPGPTPNSSEEVRAAHALMEAFAAAVAPAVAEVHARSVPPEGTRRRGRFLTTLFR